MSGRLPLLSVVVPIKSGNLDLLIRSLMAQTFEPRSFELIVVAEAGSDVDPGHWQDASFRTSLFRYERPPGFTGHSAGPMRNLGLRQAEADRIVFIDADCLLAPGGLARHAAAIDEPGSVALCGLARELPAKLSRDRLLEYSHDELWVLSARDRREPGRDDDAPPAPATWLDFYSCNASAPRDLIVKAGMFDEAGYRCHDLDLAYRLHLAGARFRLDLDCEAIHLEHPRSAWFRQEQIKGWTWLAEKHPELRALVEDKVVTLRRSRRRTLDKAEGRFAAITRGLPGMRCASTWVFPEDIQPSIIRRALAGIPFTRQTRRGTAEYFLRLEKHCWDYSFLQPAAARQPLVSVVIAAHNADGTIRRAVESVLRQTDQAFELIVVDDGSTDLTARVLVPYYAAKRLRVLVNGDNRGLAYCLNRALEACRGAYLLQLDADDWLEPAALAKLIDAFESKPDVGAIYGAPRVHGTKTGPGQEPRQEGGFQISTPADCLTYAYYQAPRIYRVAALKEAGGWKTGDAYEGRYFEDRVMLSAVAERHRVLFIREPLYNVAAGGETLSRRKPLKAASAKLAILYGQAGLRGQTLNYAFSGRLVSAKSFADPESPKPGRWSVVIPFCGSVEPLVLTLRSWLQSGFGDRQVEIIVVVDGRNSRIDAAQLPQSPLLRIVEREEQGGPAAARNTGAAQARHEGLFFCDADRIVPPNLLAMHEARHVHAGGGALVVGDVFGRRTFAHVSEDLSARRKRRLLEGLRFRPEFATVAEGLVRGERLGLIDPAAPSVWRAAQPFAFTDSWQRRWGEILLQHGEDLKYYPHRWLRVGAGSLSMARATFESLGGFDESFMAMEDWELGIRAQMAGRGIICAPEGEPLHQMHGLQEGRLRAEAEGRAGLERKHPETIELLRRAGPDLIPPGGDQFLSLDAKHLSARTEAWDAGRERANVDEVVLSFDDGPLDHCSSRILDVLESADATAVFFVLGSRAKRSAEIIRRMLRAGHEVGVHGWHHQSWTELTRDEVRSEVSRTVKLIEDLGGSRVRYFRPPYGQLPVHAAAACSDLGLTAVGWHLSSRDWLGLPVSEIQIELASQRLGGKVLLFHDGYGDPEATASVLRWLVPACQNAGIRPTGLATFLRRHEAPSLKSPPPTRIR
jgi:glycosyltransferase involved in cell wall biosynthesis/peptidoglycan/xylan/chitin deacetylase (PgdA/CDA1 family)